MADVLGRYGTFRAVVSTNVVEDSLLYHGSVGIQHTDRRINL